MRLPDARNGTAIACNEPVLGIENRQELTPGGLGALVEIKGGAKAPACLALFESVD